MTITLRPALAADLEWLDRLHTDCMRGYVEAHHPWNPTLFRETFDPAVNRVIVVDDVDAGLVSCWDEPDAVRVGNLLVASEHRGRGIGTSVLLGILDEARARAMPVRLRVLKGNPAQELYERLGFVVESELAIASMMTSTITPAHSSTNRRQHHPTPGPR